MLYLNNFIESLRNFNNLNDNKISNIPPLVSRLSDWVTIPTPSDSTVSVTKVTILEKQPETQTIVQNALPSTVAPAPKPTFAEQLQAQRGLLTNVSEPTIKGTPGKIITENAANHTRLCDSARALSRHAEGLQALSGNVPVDRTLEQLIQDFNTQLSLMLPEFGKADWNNWHPIVLIVLKNAPAAAAYRAQIEAALAKK